MKKRNKFSKAYGLSIHVAVLNMLDDANEPFSAEYHARESNPSFKLEKWVAQVVQHLLSRARVVITTISNSASKEIRRAFKPAAIIVDEAANATEAETLALLANYSDPVRIVLLVGDQA